MSRWFVVATTLGLCLPACESITSIPAVPAPLIKTTRDEPGSRCAQGGNALSIGFDSNNDGTLQDSEVTSTSSICNVGAPLIKVEAEPVGTRCVAGGSAIKSGTDSNGDSVLDEREVNTTQYVCNGVSGALTDGGSALVSLVSVDTATGTDCANGGTRIRSGVDLNHNGLLDASEVASTSYACNGNNGTNGQDGLSAMVSQSSIDGGSCPSGGVALSSGVDTNDNGTLDGTEVLSSNVLCNGPNLGTTAGTALRGDAFITTPLTLQVPSQHLTIQAALDSLVNRRITQSGLVTVQVADGVYTSTTAIVLNHPDGERIRVVGNMNTPSNVKLVFTQSNGVEIRSGGELRGMLVSGPNSADTAYYGVLAYNAPATLQNLEIEKFIIGLSARYTSAVIASGLKIKSCSSSIAAQDAVAAAVYVEANASAYLGSNAIITGCEYGVLTHWNGYVNAYRANIRAQRFPLLADHASAILAHEAQVACDGPLDGETTGIYAANASFVYAENATVQGCSIGVSSNRGSSIESTGAELKNVSHAVVVSSHQGHVAGRFMRGSCVASAPPPNARHGIYAGFNSHVYAADATLTGCRNGYEALYTSTIDAPNAVAISSDENGFAARYTSTIVATASSAVDGGVPYTPAPNTLGPSAGFLIK